MQRVILTIQDGFAPWPEWIFQPVAEETPFVTASIGNEWTFTVPAGDDWRIGMKAVKRGDVNYSAAVTP